MYVLFKTLHIIGVVVLLGNVTITAYWKVLADRSNDTRLIAHAQHGVTIADWTFTLAGIVLILVGGYGAAAVAGLSITTSTWLILGQLLFAVSGLVWISILIPIQSGKRGLLVHSYPTTRFLCSIATTVGAG